MTSKDALEQKIGEAWKAHYAGQNESALEQFRVLAEQYPDHIDVMWGLGLAYRKVEDFENAVQAFQHVKELVDGELDSAPEEFERFLMLKRMADQQITQVDKFLR